MSIFSEGLKDQNPPEPRSRKESRSRPTERMEQVGGGCLRGKHRPGTGLQRARSPAPAVVRPSRLPGTAPVNWTRLGFPHAPPRRNPSSRRPAKRYAPFWVFGEGVKHTAWARVSCSSGERLGHTCGSDLPDPTWWRMRLARPGYKPPKCGLWFV